MKKAVERQANLLLDKTNKILQADARYILKGGFWITLGQALSSASAFILSIAYANWLTPETYGTYKYVLSLMSILSIPTLTGMGTAVAQAVARGQEGSLLFALKVKIKWGLLSSLASLAVAGYYYLNDNATLGSAFLLASFFIPFIESFGIYDSLFHGRKQFRLTTIYYASAQLLATSAILITSFFNQTLMFILLAYFIAWTLARGILLRHALVKYRPNTETSAETISYGKHLSMINAFNTIANYLDKVLLFQFAGAATLAVYSIIQAPVDQLRSLSSRGISLLAFPKYATKNPSDLKDHVNTWTKRALIALAVTAIFYVLLIPLVFPLIFPAYAKDVWYSQIAALGLIPLASFIPYTALSARAMKKQLYYFNFSSAAFQILTIVTLGYWFGLIGIIVARISARFFDLAISWSLVQTGHTTLLTQVEITPTKTPKV